MKHLATPQMSISYRYMNIHMIKNIHTKDWKWKLLSHVQLFATPWTIESMEFSRPEYRSGYPFPSPGNIPKPGIKPRSPTLQTDSLQTELQVKPKKTGMGSLSFLQWIFPTQESNRQVNSLPTELSGKPAKEWNWTPVSSHKKQTNKQTQKDRRLGWRPETIKLPGKKI